MAFGRYFLVVWGILAAFAPAAAQPLTVEQRREVAGAAATAYADFYVFADRGAAIAAHLRAQAAAGAYDAPPIPPPSPPRSQPRSARYNRTDTSRFSRPGPRPPPPVSRKAGPSGSVGSNGCVDAIMILSAPSGWRATSAICDSIPPRRLSLRGLPPPRRWPSSPNRTRSSSISGRTVGVPATWSASSPAISLQNPLGLAAASAATGVRRSPMR